MKIAVLGGSFDPPHLGHVLIARQILEFTKIDEVWLLPVATHAFDKKTSSAVDRFEMTRLTEETRIKASDFEIKIGGISKTINTLRKLKKQYPNDQFTFIIGSDQLSNFKKWHEWKNIIKEFGLIIFPREIVQKKLKDVFLETLGFDKIPENVILLDSEDLILTNISSSKIRKRVKEKMSLDTLVSKGVEKYIRRKKLYV